MGGAGGEAGVGGPFVNSGVGVEWLGGHRSSRMVRLPEIPQETVLNTTVLVGTQESPLDVT